MNKHNLSCFFVSDLHGKADRYKKLFNAIKTEKPAVVFLGGDLLPHRMQTFYEDGVEKDFIEDFLYDNFFNLKSELKDDYPEILLILGNDDPKVAEPDIEKIASEDLIKYIHNKRIEIGDYYIYGYSYIPPTPFLLKDWEKYDISRYISPGDVSPEEGYRSVNVPQNEIKYSTIKKDLESLVSNDDLNKALFLFHAPPYKSNLDRAALDNKYIDHVPLDVHVGSIAVREFLEQRSPLLSMHGHIHESYRIMGDWKDMVGKTTALSAAHDGSELALVRFDLDRLDLATREHI